MLERIKEMFSQVCQTIDCILLECSGETDHVHLLIDFHPKHSISAVAGSLKAATSRLVKKEFPVEFAKWYNKQSFWSGSYYVASSGGAPINKLKELIYLAKYTVSTAKHSSVPLLAKAWRGLAIPVVALRGASRTPLRLPGFRSSRVLGGFEYFDHPAGWTRQC